MASNPCVVRIGLKTKADPIVVCRAFDPTGCGTFGRGDVAT